MPVGNASHCGASELRLHADRMAREAARLAAVAEGLGEASLLLHGVDTFVKGIDFAQKFTDRAVAAYDKWRRGVSESPDTVSDSKGLRLPDLPRAGNGKKAKDKAR